MLYIKKPPTDATSGRQRKVLGESMNNKANEPDTFDFHIDGEHQIQAELLSNILYDISKLAEIIADEEGSEKGYKLNVTAFEKGSFGIVFNLQDIINGIGVAANIITCLVGAFELKKHLKGKKPKQVSEFDDNTIKVENNYGNIIIVPKSSGVVINNDMADYHISNISNNIKIHNPQGGFTISSKDETLSCSSEDVENLSVKMFSTRNTINEYNLPEYTTRELPESEIRKLEFAEPYINVFDAELVIKKPDILGDGAWEFLLDNKNIKAKILDEEWLFNFHKNTPALRSGCYISASVQASYKKDSYGNPTGRATYRVIKVYGNIKA